MDVNRSDDDDVIGEGKNMPERPAAPILDLSSGQAMATKSGLPDPPQVSRKEKRKQLKKLRRKQIRQQVAEEEKLKESAGLDDAAEQLRLQVEEQAEGERLAKEKAEHDEQERRWLDREMKAMEDFQHQQEETKKLDEDREPRDAEEDGEYVDDDGPAEIIWKGNEIIVRKRRVRVPADPPASLQDDTQATSNPLPPQNVAFAAHNKYLQSPAVSDQRTTLFGTEQDKTHCPFHIKTGVCRFGVRCSRVHVYPERSFTLLMRNMYTGPGLAREHDEGLENSVERSYRRNMDGRRFWWLDEPQRATVDEEVAEHYKEFYEDVHSEFLQFGELGNFKVCNNASSHLRGNLYVHYKTEASAQAAYSALNGRFYAGKQITCEFVGVTRWRVALCGEYMKGRYRICSHGSACNFLHCFRNPHGEYEWADWDAPCPRFWAAKMAKLFGYENDFDQERDDDSHDGLQRHRSPDSPEHRESRRWERRSRDRHHHTSRDDLENPARRRGRRRQENGGDDHYRRSSDDPGRSSRHRRRRHRSRDADDFSSSKELDERGRGNDFETNDGVLPSGSESVTRDYRELRDDAVGQLQKRHKSGSGDVQEEVDDDSGRVSSRDRTASNGLFQDIDDDNKYKRHRSRDLRDSDRRQSLDLRSSRGRSNTRTESKGKDEPFKEKHSKEAIETRKRNDKRGSVDLSDSSDSSESYRRLKRLRYSEGKRSRRMKTITPDRMTEREKSPAIYDRWTGTVES